jgi:hypothetical protein
VRDAVGRGRGPYCSTNLQNFGIGGCVIFQVSIGAKRKDLRVSDRTNQKEANRPGATPAQGEAGIGHKGSHMHQAVRTVLNSIDSTRRNAISGFVKSLHL